MDNENLTIINFYGVRGGVGASATLTMLAARHHRQLKQSVTIRDISYPDGSPLSGPYAKSTFFRPNSPQVEMVDVGRIADFGHPLNENVTNILVMKGPDYVGLKTFSCQELANEPFNLIILLEESNRALTVEDLRNFAGDIPILTMPWNERTARRLDAGIIDDAPIDITPYIKENHAATATPSL